IKENTSIKNMEFTVSKESANKHHVYKQLIECLSFNKTMEFINIEDFKIEKEDIEVIEKIYENRRILDKPITLLIEYSRYLDNDSKMAIYELYFKYKPNIFMKTEYDGYCLTYECGTMKIEINSL